MKHRKHPPHIFQYILISTLIFVISLFVSIIARVFLVVDFRFFSFSEEQAGLVTSMIEGVVGAIAAGLVLYQLKISNEVEEHQNDIEEARFILEYNQAFIQDENMSMVESLLERSMLGITEGPIITDENLQKFVNYLVYLEGLAPLILNKILKLDHVDDLFAYRFFLAVNNSEVQQSQLFVFPEYYRGCFKLYKHWKKFRRENDREILMEENSLDKWIYFEKYCNLNINICSASQFEDKCEIGSLIFNTDSYIYTAAFGSEKKARKSVPIIMAQKDTIFSEKNINVATLDNKIAGLTVVLEAAPKEEIVLHERYIDNADSFDHVNNNYFNQIQQYFTLPSMVYVACVSVHPQYQGKRVGDVLIKNIINKYQDRPIKLHVLCDNKKAIHLYEKYGFVIVGECQDGYAFKEQPPKCYEMIYTPGSK